ncbi:MAG: hypothetical protein ACTSYC_00325 [Promethearchaeota archaeon]
MSAAWKGISWGIIFLLGGLIFLVIPTYLIVTFWIFLNEITISGNPVYTYALFTIFIYIICILVGAIFITAMFRAFIQRKNPDLGIPKGVKRAALITDVFVIVIIVLVYLLTGSIAFFSLKPP